MKQIAFLNTGCPIARLGSYVQPGFIGLTIVIADAIDRFRHLASYKVPTAKGKWI